MTYSDKKMLLDAWLSAHMKAPLITLLDLGEIVKRQQMLHRIGKLASHLPNEICIYVLLTRIAGLNVPIYVGKSDRLMHRWRSHLNGIQRGSGRYSKWRRLLFDNEGKARYETMLMVVPSSHIEEPPIPGFPKTVGSVEYQLVSLISDAYPNTFLNVEGKPR